MRVYDSNENGGVMRRLILVGSLLLLICGSVPALPKIAVLKAIVEEGIDKSVVSLVTEKLAEELVSSKQYIVLDRTNIEQVLREKEFQASGLVKDAEVKRFGEYLGADLVVAIKVSRLSNTYLVNAKIIEVVTGAIAAQASDSQEGTAAVVVEIAERVGVRLLGGVPDNPVVKTTPSNQQSKVQSRTPAGVDSTNAIFVYITRTGEKYHRDGCRYLSESKIPISLKDAKARGYAPCSVCRPPG